MDDFLRLLGSFVLVLGFVLILARWSDSRREDKHIDALWRALQAELARANPQDVGRIKAEMGALLSRPRRFKNPFDIS